MRHDPKAVLHRRDAAIVAAIKAGESTAEVARRYALTKQHIGHIARGAGVYPSFLASQRQQARNRNAMEAQLREDRRRKRHKIDQAILAAVKAGSSIRSAIKRYGLTCGQAQTTSRKLQLGKITQHGRYATLQARLERVKRQREEMRP